MQDCENNNENERFTICLYNVPTGAHVAFLTKWEQIERAKWSSRDKVLPLLSMQSIFRKKANSKFWQNCPVKYPDRFIRFTTISSASAELNYCMYFYLCTPCTCTALGHSKLSSNLKSDKSCGFDAFWNFQSFWHSWILSEYTIIW